MINSKSTFQAQGPTAIPIAGIQALRIDDFDCFGVEGLQCGELVSTEGSLNDDVAVGVLLA